MQELRRIIYEMSQEVGYLKITTITQTVRYSHVLFYSDCYGVTQMGGRIRTSVSAHN